MLALWKLWKKSSMKRKPNNKKTTDIMNSWLAKFIAVITVVFFYVYIAGVTFYPMMCCDKPINMEFVNFALGQLSGVAMAVVMYFFGSSSQSAEKNRMINNAIDKVKQPQVVINENKKSET